MLGGGEPRSPGESQSGSSYLPPTMSPSETSKAEGLLEHPAEALSSTEPTGYRGSSSSRSTWVPAPSSSCAGIEDVARRAIRSPGSGRPAYVTRAPAVDSSRSAALERELLSTVRASLDRSGLLGALEHRLGVPRLRADAVVGEGARACSATVRVGGHSRSRWPRRSGAGARDGRRARHRYRRPARAAAGFVWSLPKGLRRSYRNYCWPVESLRDIRIAPFHVMATEGAVHTGQRSCLAHEYDQQPCSGGRRPADAHAYQVVELADPASGGAATAWWENVTETGGEGAVVKPLQFVATTSVACFSQR